MLRLLAMTAAIVVSASGAAAVDAAEGYDAGMVLRLTEKLARKLEMPEEQKATLLENVRKTVKEEWYKKQVTRRPVMAVFVYRAGEGGLLVKFMKGEGLITFRSGRKAANIDLKSWSAGAQAGGSAVWGVGLVMGLKHPNHFGGDYRGKVQTATAGDKTAQSGTLLSLDDDNQGRKAHDILLIMAAAGLSAGVGGAKMTITPGW